MYIAHEEQEHEEQEEDGEAYRAWKVSYDDILITSRGQ